MATPTPQPNPKRTSKSALALPPLKGLPRSGPPEAAATPPPMHLTPPPLPASAPPLPAIPPPLPQSPAGLAPWSQSSIGIINSAVLKEPAPVVPPPLPKDLPREEPPRETRRGAGAKTAPTLGEFGMMGPYHLKQLIGEGGMGLVYRAEDTFLKRQVALKLMKPEVAKDARAWKLFLAEAQATAALKDDRIATIYRVDEEQGQAYLAMELLKGESLEARLQRGPMPMKKALWAVREAALGLAVAHAAGLTHRDIKPANLWLETASDLANKADPLHKFRNDEADPKYLRVKILDFGLVRLEQDGDGRRKQSVVGTPAYMAPEQAAGKTADARSDIFSLGVVLFRLLTNRLPFQGETSMELITAIATQTAPPVSQFCPAAPRALVDLVRKMLSRDPLGRPGSASELARLLEGIMELTEPEPRLPKPRKKTAIIVAGGLGLAAVAACGVWLVLQNRGSAEDVPTVGSVNSDSVLSPREVVNAVGDWVKVEFTVGVVRRDEDDDEGAYLYETAPVKDELTFRVVLPPHVIGQMRKRGSQWPEVLQGAQLRLRGQVSREKNFAEILVSDVDQFDKIVYGERSSAAPKPPPQRKAAAAKPKSSQKPDVAKGMPPGIGYDQPATEPPTPRMPDAATSREMKEAVEKAARDMLLPFLGKLRPGQTPFAPVPGKNPPKPFDPPK